MDTQTIKKIFSLYDTVVVYENPRTFQEELNRQCHLVLVPTCIIAIFSWIFFIRLDVHLLNEIPVDAWIKNAVVAMRFGLTGAGIITLILHFVPFFKKFNYLLLFSLTCYFELAAAVIVGFVAPHPAYMGGIAMLILILPLMPFKKTHSLILLGAALILFIVVGIFSHMKIVGGRDLYGLFNMVAAVSVALVAIFVLDRIRRDSFDKNQTIHINNEKLKESSTEIVQMNEVLQEENDLKSKLLEIAAHDLKNPLQVIVGYTDLLQDKFAGNQLVMKNLDIIFQSSDKMIRLISKLLKSLSIESGKLMLSKRDVNITVLLESVIKDNRSYSEKKGQKIYLNAETECFVHGDESFLKEIFDNLLNNAVKFSPTNKPIWISIDRDDSIVSCKIRDEGPGFSKSDKEKMFSRFQKLSAKPTEGESATGLGLAIVRDLVELHHGEVSVESDPGAGSTFIVKLPCK
jgi:signal transduction histidine kinase